MTSPPPRAASASPQHAPPGELAGTLAELLSSMRFAVALLVAICLAATIGTVLPQGQPANAYVEQFGPFWAEVFTLAGLDHVYAARGFLAMLAVLVASTSLCLWRTAPRLLADWRDHQASRSPLCLPAGLHGQARLPGPPRALAEAALHQLARQGWRGALHAHRHAGASGILLAAQKGGARKLGYVATHAAIVLICLGAVADGDLALRLSMWRQGVTPFLGEGLIADVPARHRLGAATPAYRASIAVAEGTQARTALIAQGDGVVLQELPFSIELRRFTIDYYPTGMPRRFVSEVVLHDTDGGASRPARIEVNHPAEFKGVRIYQSSFEDGGSRLRLRARPVSGAAGEAGEADIAATVGASAPLALPWLDAGWTLEPTELRLMNVEPARPIPQMLPQPATPENAFGLGPAARPDAARRFLNLGPRIAYRLRDAAGQATEYVNYLQPVDTGDGWPMHLYGVRAAGAAATDIAYWRIPSDLDGQGGQADFWRLKAALTDANLRQQAVDRYARNTVAATSASGGATPEALAGADRDASREAAHVATTAALRASATRVLALFAGDTAPASAHAGTATPALPGLQALSAFLETQVPPDQRAQATRLLLQVLDGTLLQLLQAARQAQGLPATAWPAAGTASAPPIDTYLRMAVLALNDARLYPAPVLLDVVAFEPVQASVFQVSRAPGQPWVYLGCLLLVLGLFAMLYVHDRRLWLWLADAPQGPAPSPDTPPDTQPATPARLVYRSNRRGLHAQHEFERLCHALLGPGTAAPTPIDAHP
ncbi:MAG: cytochrome c biogenesis protein ResB [Comamonas sp.]